MPHLDGVSAAALIRQFDKDTPIIAMTSNIRSDDIQTYFDNGKMPITLDLISHVGLTLQA